MIHVYNSQTFSLLMFIEEQIWFKYIFLQVTEE